MTSLRYLPLALIVVPISQELYASTQEPIVALAENYSSSKDISNYWVSEKLDGVRALWTGSELLTRTGNSIHAPDWFVSALPDVPLDGELWAGRGNFHRVTSTVLDDIPDDEAWKNIRFMVFDMPGENIPFLQRYQAAKLIIEELDVNAVELVEHKSLVSSHELSLLLNNVEEQGGEGLMLRNIYSFYRVGRSDDLLKVKTSQDGEALIVGYSPGKGKYRGQLGSLIVVNKEGSTFRIGSGLTDEERKNPPMVGSVVSYRYNGYTSGGLPRFARFMRVRPDMNASEFQHANQTGLQ
ncbi:DNA ligase [Parasalinivibrio latis]|uniref:DNA ligase n=1 Tax=Parasalinivibrio latis TaxID=2952610 RepID=UPI0030E1A7B2